MLSKILSFVFNCLRFTLSCLILSKSSKPRIAPRQNFLRLLVLVRIFDLWPKMKIWTRAKSVIKDFVVRVNCLRFTLSHLLLSKSSKPLIAPEQNFLRLLVLVRVFDLCPKMKIWTRAKSVIKGFVLRFRPKSLSADLSFPQGLKFQGIVEYPALYYFLSHFASIYLGKKYRKKISSILTLKIFLSPRPYHNF